VNGKDWPIEMHLVHRGPGGRVAVIGVMIEAGPANPEMTKLWQKIPRQTCKTAEVTHFDLSALLPKSLKSYRYAGSLTTPSCGQGVGWNVLAEPITITEAEIRAFQSLYSKKDFPDGNRRPVQDLNGRVVVTDVR
jgi:carbonic anhydrase